jgi:DNA primase
LAVLSPGFIQDLLSRVDIVEVVGRHVELKRAGAHHKGLCPFHGEKTPSFTVSPSRQTYHCFGCGAHGDAIRFLMEHTGLGFIDAVRELAQRAGVRLPENDSTPEERARAAEQRDKQASLSEILARAARHYRESLKSSPRAIEYLKRRGLSGEIAARFGLGYAPDGWRNLASAFAHYDDAALVEAGLVIVQGEDSEERRYDRFRDRIMFPIRSVRGDVIGFGGRVLDQGEPKYLNSPETPVFVKGRELYGLFEARTALRQSGFALVVEGYMDVVALAQAGIENAVATLGTACTADHVAKLFRFTDTVVFSFDGDAAGRRAAGRALEAALPHASDLRSIRFLFLPPEHDPDSYVRELGPQAYSKAVAAAVPLSLQLLEHSAQQCDLDTAEGRARMLGQARPMWEALPDGALRTQLLADLAGRARLPVTELLRLWGRSPESQRQPGHRAAPAARRTRHAVAPSLRSPQDNIVAALMQDSLCWQQLGGPEHDLLLGLPAWHGDALRWLERQLTEHGPQPWAALRQGMAGNEWADRARALIDDAVVPADHATIDDLRALLKQLSRSLQDQQSHPVLSAVMRRPNRL